jgi:3-deoxy-D-arabino-heptulosonate 7-phosphate (DAHP) synthase class II
MTAPSFQVHLRLKIHDSNQTNLVKQITNLKENLKNVALGKAFVLQGGRASGRLLVLYGF